MTRTPTSPPAPVAAAEVRQRGRLGGRLTLTLLALIWPAQLLTTVGLFSAQSQADVAQHFQTTQIAWFTLTYLLFTTLATPMVAKLGDVFGRKRVILLTIGAGLVGDLITALAPNYSTMLVGRGIGALYGPITALALAAVRDVFPPRHVGFASSSILSTFGIVILIGPLVSGQLLDNFGFRGVMWALVAAVIVAFLLAWAFLPSVPGTGERTDFDWGGGLLLGGSAAMLILALNQGKAWGWTSGRILGITGVAVVLAVLFVLVERRVTHPLVDLRMLGRRDVAGVLATTALGQGACATFGTLLVFVTLFPTIPGVSEGLGWTVTHSAIIGIPGSLVLVAAGLTAGWLSRRVDPRLPWMVGLVAAAAGLTLLAFFHHNELQIIVGCSVTGIGGGLVAGCVPVLLLGVVSMEEQGMASGMLWMLINLMGTLTVAIMFAALNGSSTVFHGTAFYHDSGYRNAFLSLVACLLVALLLSLLIRPVRRSSEVESGTAVGRSGG